MNTEIVPSNFQFLMNTLRPDGMVSITSLASAYKEATGIRKDPRNWLVTQEATESKTFLSLVTGIPVTDLVKSTKQTGTWVHPKLAEIFAQWCSVEYRFVVVQLIEDAKRAAEMKPTQVRQLAPQRDVLDYGNMIIGMGLQDDPMIKAALTQRILEQLSNQTHLATLAAPEQPLNVTSIASNMGYSQAEIGTGAKLGKYIKLKHEPIGKSQHGKYQVYVYLPSEVEDSITGFFSSPS